MEQVTEQHGLKSHLYADEIQAYNFYSPGGAGLQQMRCSFIIVNENENEKWN